MRISTPYMRVRTRTPQRIYPPPPIAVIATKAVLTAVIENASRDLDHLPHGTDDERGVAAAEWWDVFKLSVTKSCRVTTKDCKLKVTNSYRQRLKRFGSLHRLAAADGDASAEVSMMNKIVETRLEWARCKARRLRVRNSTPPALRGKEFYRRIAPKFADNTVVSLGPGTAGSTSRHLANVMANGWSPVMRQRQARLGAVRSYLGACPIGDRAELDELAEPIRQDEVVCAVKLCKRGKAQGPDGLPNDWYQDYATVITPLLARLFNLWLKGGVVPATCTEANVHCLTKAPTACSPLEHRLFALLNSDYKIYTRVFALRLRPRLAELVHSSQAGFVPGRTIHTTIDTFLAAQRLTRDSPESARAVCVMLDFAKAYDSLSRPFLLEVLSWRGFPSAFIRMVGATHSNTTGRFLVNGFLSAPLRVTCGIRQGCPLAPLLFILVLDILYHRVEARHDARGLMIPKQGREQELRIAGYADDTALYLRGAGTTAVVLGELSSFGQASGLKVNIGKSVVLPLGDSERENTTTMLGALSRLQSGATCRYLGIQAGATGTETANWGGDDTRLPGQAALRHRENTYDDAEG